MRDRGSIWIRLNSDSILLRSRPAGALSFRTPVKPLGSPTGKVARPPSLGQREALRGVRLRMLLVTGGAGFIGSNVVASLNETGRSDVVVNDSLGDDEKWRNLAKRQLADV